MSCIWTLRLKMQGLDYVLNRNVRDPMFVDLDPNSPEFKLVPYFHAHFLFETIGFWYSDNWIPMTIWRLAAGLIMETTTLISLATKGVAKQPETRILRQDSQKEVGNK